jgi:hypothetical protein
MESISSGSLFQVEIASPMATGDDGQPMHSGAEQESHSGPTDRIGKVFNYSDTGGLGSGDG